KGWERFLGVETPLFESMLVVRDVAEAAEAQVPAQGDDVQEPAAEEVVTDQLEIVKLKARVKKLEKINKFKSSKLRRLKKVGTSQRIESSDDMEHVFNQGRIIVGVVIRDPEEELSFDTPAENPKVKDKGKGILIKAPKPMKKKDRIELDAEYARKLQEEINKEHEKAYKNID
nr:hypothetical protein [Tanacetum cinerariifolium]